MENEIIVLKQLPEIEERLQEIKEDVTKRVQTAMSLVCTEETVKEIKSVRAELNKEFAHWEEKRKEVKRAIMLPYERFDEKYKDCITALYKTADTTLKSQINSVEDALKAEKARELLDYFNEYICASEISTGIPLFEFVTLEKANINVTKSASLKSLKEQAKAFIDRVCEDLNLIDTQEHKDEILYEYKQSLNVSNAITTVANRYRAIEQAKAKEEERKAKAEAEQKAVEKVEAVAEVLAPPPVEPIAPPIEEEKILKMSFTVKGTMPQLKELKQFIIEKGIEIL